MTIAIGTPALAFYRLLGVVYPYNRGNVFLLKKNIRKDQVVEVYANSDDALSVEIRDFIKSSLGNVDISELVFYGYIPLGRPGLWVIIINKKYDFA